MRKIKDKFGFAESNPGGGYYKGFTLIELLAIIVILAIIAVITVPLILGIINDAKLNSITDSAYGYKSAIQNYSMYLQTVNSDNPGIKGSYTVQELKTLGLEVKGQEPSEGIILVDNEGISGCLKYNEYASYMYNNEVINTSKGNCPTQKLVTTGDGLYKSNTEPGRLIYRGQNPNNRIFLKEDGTNNTLYRIVSYEVDGTIKVVRDEKIGDKVWDASNARKSDGTNNTYCTSESGCNVWGNGSNTLFNGASLGSSFHYSYYANSTTTTLTTNASYAAGTVNDESTLNKYLNQTWLSDIDFIDIIDTHGFNVGVVYYTNALQNKGLKREKEEESLYIWNGKIGLLNITEFVESSTNVACTDVWSTYYSNSNREGWPCKESNWNFKSTYNQWTITSSPNAKVYVWYIDKTGFLLAGGTHMVSTSFGVRPSFYLKSGISLSGTGAENNEYEIVG